jgi:hypothetical protein
MSDNAKLTEMIEDCESVRHIEKEKGGPNFNKWELDFLDSIIEQYEEKCWLSEKQIEILEKMWDKI